MTERLDTPTDRRSWFPRRPKDSDKIGRISESVAVFFGTPRFLVYLTIFVALWLVWNSFAPIDWRFDSQEFGFTLLTLMLSLQASYSSPLILLAQSRQVDRDRVSAEQDRQRAERTLADTEFLTREIASLRLSMSEVATRDFVRSELRDRVSDEIDQRDRRIAELEREVDRLRGGGSDERDAASPSEGAESHPGP